MKYAYFGFKRNDVEKIQNLLLATPQNAEKVINNYLHNIAKEKLVNSITNFIPVSDIKTKIHAKESKWYETKDWNLAVEVKNARKFYYIYFPLTAQGTSEGKMPNDFFLKGMMAVYDDVVEELLEELENNLLGGK